MAAPATPPLSPTAAGGGGGGGGSSRLHLLSSGDISALLRWGGLEASGGRAEQLGRLQAALESVQAREPDRDQPEAQAVRSWLVDPFSSWRFELSSGSERGVALGRQTTAPLDAAEAQAQQQPECVLPSDAKVRHPSAAAAQR